MEWVHSVIREDSGLIAVLTCNVKQRQASQFSDDAAYRKQKRAVPLPQSHPGVLKILQSDAESIDQLNHLNSCLLLEGRSLVATASNTCCRYHFSSHGYFNRVVTKPFEKYIGLYQGTHVELAVQHLG